MTANVNSGSTYVIQNVKSGTVVDLSAGNNRTVTGWAQNGGANQHWVANWTGSGWSFRSAYTGSYLAIEGNANDGTNITASSTPYQWDVWRDPNNQNTFRIYVPNTYQNFDLYGNGQTAWGTPITLWSAWNGTHQTWVFNEVS